MGAIIAMAAEPGLRAAFTRGSFPRRCRSKEAEYSLGSGLAEAILKALQKRVPRRTTLTSFFTVAGLDPAIQPPRVRAASESARSQNRSNP